MYASPGQRNAEIEVGAGRPAGELRHWVADSAAQLAEDLGRLTGEAWQAAVITAQGRTVPATEIPWLRAREVYVHAVDLAADTGAQWQVTGQGDEYPAQAPLSVLTEWMTGRNATGTLPQLPPWL